MPDDITLALPSEEQSSAPIVIYNKWYHYLGKSCKWFFGNSVFGLFPLIIMTVVSWLTHGKEGSLEMSKLIYEGGIILFVAIAIMGSVVVDYMLSHIESEGLDIFTVYIFPCLITGFVTLEFLLVCFNKVNRMALSLGSKKTIVILLTCVVYSVLTKSTFYLKEDTIQR